MDGLNRNYLINDFPFYLGPRPFPQRYFRFIFHGINNECFEFIFSLSLQSVELRDELLEEEPKQSNNGKNNDSKN